MRIANPPRINRSVQRAWFIVRTIEDHSEGSHSMIFEDTIRIDAAAQAVWDVLLDVNAIAACMPGIERVVQVDERTFDGAILASVGPISGTFSFRAQILDSTPPRSMTAEVVGTDSVTKSTIRADTAFTLDPVDGTEPNAFIVAQGLVGGSTDLSYRANVQIQGRLAVLGDMVLRATAVLILEEFAKRLRQRVASNTVGSSPST